MDVSTLHGDVMATQKPRVSIVIDQSLLEELDELAAKMERPRSWVIVHAVKKLLEQESKPGN